MDELAKSTEAKPKVDWFLTQPCNAPEMAKFYWGNYPKPIKNPSWKKDISACKRFLDNGNTPEQFVELCRKAWELNIEEGLFGPAYLISKAHLIQVAEEKPTLKTPEEVSANLALVSEARENLARLFKSNYKPQYISDIEDRKRLFGRG